MSLKYDAVVVGARCAGAATAMLLARAGARVLMVDKGAYGTDILSTHALMRGAVLQLHRWGVLPAIVAAGTPRVQSTTFSYPDHDITVQIDARMGVDALYAPRRALLDRVLVDAAAQSGVKVRYGVRVEDLVRDERGRVRGIDVAAGGHERIAADMVIGADGLHSTIAGRVEAATEVEGRHTSGVLYGYWEGLHVSGYHWWYRPGASIGVIPTNDGRTCVFVAGPADRVRAEMRGDATAAYERLLRQASAKFADGLAGARRVEPVHGFPGHPGFIKRSSGAGWALVGDAAYFKDPLTAHGITDALRDAELLARAAIAGTAKAFAEYEAVRMDLSRRLFEVTDRIASFQWDNTELPALHKAFSKEMAREVQALANLGAMGAIGAIGAAVDAPLALKAPIEGILPSATP